MSRLAHSLPASLSLWFSSGEEREAGACLLAVAHARSHAALRTLKPHTHLHTPPCLARARVGVCSPSKKNRARIGNERRPACARRGPATPSPYACPGAAACGGGCGIPPPAGPGADPVTVQAESVAAAALAVNGGRPAAALVDLLTLVVRRAGVADAPAAAAGVA